jgi:hypothetical protein
MQLRLLLPPLCHLLAPAQLLQVLFTVVRASDNIYYHLFSVRITLCCQRGHRELLHTIEPNLLSINDNLTQWNRTNNRRARDAAASRSQEESDARDATRSQNFPSIFLFLPSLQVFTSVSSLQNAQTSTQVK